MEENGVEHNYLYLGLEWPYAMMLFIRHYSVQFSKCDAYYMQNIMPSADENTCK